MTEQVTAGHWESFSQAGNWHVLWNYCFTKLWDKFGRFFEDVKKASKEELVDLDFPEDIGKVLS